MNTQQKKEFIRELLGNASGKFFSVKFIKADGDMRLLTGRLGVKKGLVGGENTVKNIDKYLTVFDTSKKQYRNVNLETVKEIHLNRQYYKFDEVA